MFICIQQCLQQVSQIWMILIALHLVEGAMASWLVRSTPDRAVFVYALAGNTLLCSLAWHSTLMVPLPTQMCKRVLSNLMLGVTLRWTSIPSRGGRVEILSVAADLNFTLCFSNCQVGQGPCLLGSILRLLSTMKQLFELLHLITISLFVYYFRQVYGVSL